MARFDTLEGWLNWQEGFHPRSIDLGLDRAAAVFSILNPEKIKPPTIVVAGTNGKGSCIGFLEAIYRAQGYRVGAYSSPHILKYNERIRINGESVEDHLICQSFERIDLARSGVSLSYFEFGTLAALDIFYRSDLDIQLLEVGLGGRLDAVNIVDADVSLITSICIDHVDWLGKTREAIGFEKAGIFRSGIPAVIGDIDPPKTLLQRAETLTTPIFRIHQEFDFQKDDKTWDWSSLTSEKKSFKNLPIPALKGEHQFRNAASVLMALVAMEEKLAIDESSIHQGLQAINLKGRFQLIEGNIPVLLDVAHNPQAVTALAEYLRENFSGIKIHAVFAMMKDKDILSVIAIIKPLIDEWFFAPLENPRAANEEMMRECFSLSHLQNVNFSSKDSLQAFQVAEENADQGDLIVIFGSFFLVSEYLARASHI